MSLGAHVDVFTIVDSGLKATRRSSFMINQLYVFVGLWLWRAVAQLADNKVRSYFVSFDVSSFIWRSRTTCTRLRQLRPAEVGPSVDRCDVKLMTASTQEAVVSHQRSYIGAITSFTRAYIEDDDLLLRITRYERSTKLMSDSHCMTKWKGCCSKDYYSSLVFGAVNCMIL